MGEGDKRSNRTPPNAVLSSRLALAILFLTATATISLLIFFYYVRLSLKLSRHFPGIKFDAEQKDDSRGPSLDAWEIIICSLLPVLIWRYRWQCSQYFTLRIGRSSTTRQRCICLAIATVSILGIHRLLFPTNLCHGSSDGWMMTDVGYIRKAPSSMGVSMRTLCSGRVWEPHVAHAIEQHLYGQGRAIDVGAFVGYHTIRLAKAAAPFDVYAFEGRPPTDLKDNLRRNNAMNVELKKETIDTIWKLGAEFEEVLLDEAKGPVAFIKIDCEGCELLFLKGTESVLKRWHPVVVVEVQDDESRRNVRLGGQQMIKPTRTRSDVLDFLEGLGYTIQPLLDEDGKETWDYLAFWL